ncbi:MAG: heme exporter protein CcmD [Deinococcus sp.]|nr:heme exporter protein CcmD [Deinococcus sp.]
MTHTVYIVAAYGIAFGVLVGYYLSLIQRTAEAKKDLAARRRDA